MPKPQAVYKWQQQETANSWNMFQQPKIWLSPRWNILVEKLTVHKLIKNSLKFHYRFSTKPRKPSLRLHYPFRYDPI